MKITLIFSLKKKNHCLQNLFLKPLTSWISSPHLVGALLPLCQCGLSWELPASPLSLQEPAQDCTLTLMCHSTHLSWHISATEINHYHIIQAAKSPTIKKPQTLSYL